MWVALGLANRMSGLCNIGEVSLYPKRIVMLLHLDVGSSDGFPAMCRALVHGHERCGSDLVAEDFSAVESSGGAHDFCGAR